MELGSNYDWPIVTDSEARAHVVHACHVIERCITARTGSEGDRLAVVPMTQLETNELKLMTTYLQTLEPAMHAPN